MSMDGPDNEGPKLNPELEQRAKIPSLTKLRAWLDRKEIPSTRQRILEGVVCALVAGVMIWMVMP